MLERCDVCYKYYAIWGCKGLAIKPDYILNCRYELYKFCLFVKYKDVNYLTNYRNFKGMCKVVYYNLPLCRIDWLKLCSLKLIVSVNDYRISAYWHLVGQFINVGTMHNVSADTYFYI